MLTRRYHQGGEKRSLSYYPTTFFISFMLIGCFLPSCSPEIIEKLVTVTNTEVRDSLAWRDTTIYVPIPLESDQAIVHVGDTSHRETSIAESDAWIGKDGMIHHSLRNKANARLSYNLKMPERWLYTNVTNTKEHEQGIIKEVKVEKPLSWAQKAKLRLFPWLLAALIGLTAWTTKKWWLPLVK